MPRLNSSALCATALIMLIASASALIRARPAYLIIHDNHKLVSNMKVQWLTSISYAGKSMSTAREVSKKTTEGMFEFPIPKVSSCGAIRASTRLGWIQGSRSDQRCLRPTLDINSAYITGTGRAYCAETYYRSCSAWRCKCKVAFSIRVSIVDANDYYMSVRNLGSFRACGFLTNEELLKAKKKYGAKKL